MVEASKTPALVMARVADAVMVPTTWWVSLVTDVVTYDPVPVARASADSVNSVVSVAAVVPAAVPQPTNLGSAYVGVAPNMRPLMIALPAFTTSVAMSLPLQLERQPAQWVLVPVRDDAQVFPGAVSSDDHGLERDLLDVLASFHVSPSG